MSEETQQTQENRVKSRLPAVFQEATWLATTPVDDATEHVGLSINVGGQKVHLRLDLMSALDIVATLAEALSAHQRRRPHSDTSAVGRAVT